MIRIMIIGAGPAGIACAHTLAGAGEPSLVIEKQDSPGGLCRTINFGGYFFDIGGHRFLSKSDEINSLWQRVMNGQMLLVKRLSRIYYKKLFFNYPLSFFNTFGNLGPSESFLCIASYLKCKLFKPGNDSTFEGYIINRFGKRLYDIFFKTYTEKVWATPCKDISANWARQRLCGLSLRVALEKALVKKKRNLPKTLSGEFLYPKRGPGEFYSRLEKLALSGGARFEYDKFIRGIEHDGERVRSVEVLNCRENRKDQMPVDYLFSSMALPVLIESLRPLPPGNVIAAARKLRFRNFLVVNLILNRQDLFPDQWLYIHSPQVRLGRIQNYKNWSPDMVSDSKKTTLGLEYFCGQDDFLWKMNDIDLIHYAVRELQAIGIEAQKYLINGFVVRCPMVYPIYSLDYQKNLGVIKAYLSRFSNLKTMGRAGLFRYDNSDHALLTGIYAARNFLGQGLHDIWAVNTDPVYLEA
ncbi:MAG: NAD(P)/FAD-dependent oxidoreductase [Candidatus Omnitrophica bacterium]|nr:NAD(P)/FAD-dependent oxidoreductase [Candidatus Omnitrophota bacterium]